MNLPSRYKPTGTSFGGGQAVVTVWKDTALGRDVAVKVLATRGIGGSLLDEAALLAAIKSKHVVELFELGVDNSGTEYLIMEYVPGADLKGFIPKTRRELYLTLFQIACGLGDIHRVKCIHRDVKPVNMRRDAAGVIKLIDFGIGSAKDPVVTKSGRGTDGYRAPEYDSAPMKLTSAVDIYAFGVTAYRFCFGKLDPTLLRWPPQQPPSFSKATIGTASAVLDVEIVRLLDKCFAADAKDRPKAADLKTAFAKHLLRTKHIAKFTHNGQTYTLSQASKRYRIAGAKGAFEVSYTGLDFILSQVSGEVYVNGVAANAGMSLPGSCVITLGSGSGADRDFIPFNVSHPEVVL
jgi:eukaryotic-like serine/threonine-protein kinase